ncbi:hypothetical protein [Nocardia pseudobrasiliensis]|uniref:Uncharacterized protein n=1 Tax=Nocardia pseudobrasiliensis TaxID=45979 RepID=A0A370I229_9NOCA|nr:hypothetical protein [Nocardia pseudobrasiliensis]RDI64798.1 hypothetical protein DFR76_107174 [Nocardia pseudobrasiliensis]
MPHILDLIAAARRGRRAVRAARKSGYHSEIARVAGSAPVGGQVCTRPAHDDVRPLRALWRITTLNRKADQEPIYLTAALLAHGRDTVLTIGRESAPPGREAHHLLWVSVDGEVVSTGLPVAELCVPLATLPPRHGPESSRTI